MFFINRSAISWSVILIMVMLLSLVIVYADSLSIPSEKTSDGVVAILSAFVGMLITIAVTAILLNRQTEVKSSKERHMRQFEKKQETYYAFLEELGNIIATMLQRSLRGNDKKAYENVTSLSSLIFQFGYLRMHMEDETFLNVMACVSNIFNKYRELKIRDVYQSEILQSGHQRSVEVNNRLFCFSVVLSEELFHISSILNNDMYQGKSEFESNNKIENEIHRLLNSCGLKNMNLKQ